MVATVSLKACMESVNIQIWILALNMKTVTIRRT